jgi:hypothetical protein
VTALARPVPAWPIIAAAVCLLAGLLLGWWIWHPRAIFEPAAPSVLLPSGGQVLERDPAAQPPATVVTAAREAGGVLERAISVTVQPTPIPTPAPTTPIPSHPPGSAEDVAAPAAGCSCAPVTVDLGLVRMPDRTRRVVATSRDGQLLGGVDIPIDSLAIARPRHWAAGATVAFTNTGQRHYGAFVDRDLGPLRLGVEVGQRDGGAAVVLRAGIRF